MKVSNFFGNVVSILKTKVSIRLELLQCCVANSVLFHLIFYLKPGNMLVETVLDTGRGFQILGPYE